MGDTSKKSKPHIRRVVWGRQFLASTVVRPHPDVRAEHLNTDAMAVLAVIRNEAQADEKCSLPVARIAERANIGRRRRGLLLGSRRNSVDGSRGDTPRPKARRRDSVPLFECFIRTF